MKPQLNERFQYHNHINKDDSYQQIQKIMIKSQNKTQKWMTRMKSSENITKSIK